MASRRHTLPQSPVSTRIDTSVVSEPQRAPTNIHLLHWNELPSWQRDNHHIIKHYRPASGSYHTSCQSLFYLHNESVNIHTHLLGAFLFLSVSFSIYLFNYRSVANADICAFACFFLGAVSSPLFDIVNCLLVSSPRSP